MSDSVKTPEQWGQDFTRARANHVDFTDGLARLLKQVLDHETIQVAQLEARTKTAESFADKIARKSDKYVNPLSEITDLTGLRVILYYPADVVEVGALIEREFDVDWENSVRQGADSEPDRFGYRSDHYIVRLGPQRRRLAEWKPFVDHRAEIQVRTVMQHAWAAVDHKIRYKGDDLPRDLQRRLSRLSALLEVADEQFAALQRASDDVVVSYRESVARGDLDVALDALSLRAYLDATGAGESWSAVAVEVGFRVMPEISELTAIDPRAHRIEELLDVLQRLGLTSLNEFGQILRSADGWGREALTTVVRGTESFAGRTDPPPIAQGIMAIPEDVLTILSLVAKGHTDGLDEALHTANFRDDINAGIKDAVAKAK
jgi:putative GTP pyrophosphokinase